MPTREEVLADIEAKITDKTPSDKVQNTEDGANRVLIMDYIDQEVDSVSVKKEMCGFLSYDGTNFTYTSVLNQTTASTISWVGFGGVVYGTVSDSVLTDKTFIQDRTLNTDGGYLITCRRSNSTNFEMAFVTTSGLSSSVPNFTNLPIKIEIYN